MPLIARYHILFCCLFFLAVFGLQQNPTITIALPLILFILVYLFYLLPFFIVREVLGKAWHPFDTFFFGLGLFFFFFTSLFYIGVKLQLLTLSIEHISLFFCSILLLLYLGLLVRKPSARAPLPTFFPHPKKIIPLTLAILRFALLHVSFFHFYHFIPEWDGYTDITSIERNISDQTFHQEYRAFFQASVSILSVLLQASPYTLFIFLFIPLHLTYFLVTYRILERKGKLSPLYQLTTYALLLSIPVLSMEIDMTRPQNILLIFLPIIFYLVLLIEESFSVTLTGLLLVILVAGVKYHEFFWFFLLLTPTVFLPKILERKEIFKNPAIIVGTLSTASILIAVLFSLSDTLRYFALKVLLDISDYTKWHIWFLSSYSNSGSGAHNNVGWQGILGATQYYGYYLSPAILILFLSLFFFFIFDKRSRSFFLKPSSLYLTGLLIVWITFAEILPRLNSPFIPERYWIFFDLTLLFLFLLFITERKEVRIRTFHCRLLMFILFLSAVLGISASLYIAHGKKSLTTSDEYQVALWIEQNLPKNALIISQPANAPLIQNFGKRELLTPRESFFLSDHYETIVPANQNARLERVIARLMEHPIKETASIIHDIEYVIHKNKDLEKRPLYILYSKQKFSTLYATRDWYQNQNFFDAQLDKFSPLEKIYDINGISLWKISSLE